MHIKFVQKPLEFGSIFSNLCIWTLQPQINDLTSWHKIVGSSDLGLFCQQFLNAPRKKDILIWNFEPLSNQVSLRKCRLASGLSPPISCEKLCQIKGFFFHSTWRESSSRKARSSQAKRKSFLWQVIKCCQILQVQFGRSASCLLYTSPSPRDLSTSRMPSSA